MQLYYTPRSHFSRKVRILLDAWQMPVELIDVGDVSDRSAFGANPLMKVPTLVDGETWLIDSDHIARYLVRIYQPQDDFSVLDESVSTLNFRAVMNGIMAAEVEWLLARRPGIPTDLYRRFDKILDSMRQGMAWLERNAAQFPSKPSYSGFHLVCLWDHLACYQTLDLTPYSNLAELCGLLSQNDFVNKSIPPAIPK